MLSERMIKKLSHDTALTRLHDCLVTYDIDPIEKLKRGIRLNDFWVENRRKYYELYKKLYIDTKQSWRAIIDFCYLMLQFKAICDGKEPTREIAGNYNLIALEEILKVAVFNSEEKD